MSFLRENPWGMENTSNNSEIRIGAGSKHWESTVLRTDNTGYEF